MGLRRISAAVAATAVTASLLGVGTGAGAAEPTVKERTGWTVPQQLRAMGLDATKRSRIPAPRGANPWAALLPRPQRADYAGWARYLDRQADQRMARRGRLTPIPTPDLVDELEPPELNGANDDIDSAQLLDVFGPERPTGVRVLGRLTNDTVRLNRRPASREDDGSIPNARATKVGRVRSGFVADGTIGDGRHGRSGTGKGDFDVYKVHGVAGKTLDLRTVSRMDTMLLLFDAEGNPIGFDDDSGRGLSSRLRYRVPTTGSYYVFVTGFDAVPRNPFRSGSGTGAASEGDYTIQIRQAVTDVDVYGVELSSGDVLGATVSGGAHTLGIMEPDGTLVHGSEQDATFIYPKNSPLPGGGNAVAEHVADQDGWHYVMVTNGSGAYDARIEAYRPRLEGNPPVQTLSLDVDGARVNTGMWDGPGIRELSPLRAYLGRWGLTNDDYQPLVDQIVATVEENIETDMAASAVNPNFAMDVRVSPDDDDPFGDDNVERVIIGGSIEESGIQTIGIAESIDPGNFGENESALVLLDVLSGDPNEWGDASLNYYLRPESDRVTFIGTAIGNVVSHEAGHFTGNWHVDQFNDQPNLMDQGGNFPVLYGVGPDGVGGTADDPDVDFGEDELNPFEGFLGIEDTLTRMATVLTQ